MRALNREHEVWQVKSIGDAVMIWAGRRALRVRDRTITSRLPRARSQAANSLSQPAGHGDPYRDGKDRCVVGVLGCMHRRYQTSDVLAESCRSSPFPACHRSSDDPATAHRRTTNHHGGPQ
jgi:hypothetical protein